MKGAVLIHDESGDTKIDRAQVVANGSKATLFEWDHQERRMRQRDRLREVVVRDTATGYVVMGASEFLMREVGLTKDEAQMTWEVTPGGCQGCR